MPFHKTYPVEKSPPKTPQQKTKQSPQEKTKSAWQAYLQWLEQGIDQAERNITRKIYGA